MTFPRYKTYRDSGIEWIGEVPSHWRSGPIRAFAKLESGHTPSRQKPEYWEDCTIPWITLADVWQIREGSTTYINETKELISELGLSNSSARLLPKDTVILSRTASVGFSAIMGREMATTQDFANWVCGTELLPEFLLYVLRSMKSEFDRLTMGSTHKTIYMPEIAKLTCPLPPIDEQSAIITRLDRETAKIDTLVAEQEKLIELLKEKRQAVISHAVTKGLDPTVPMKDSGIEWLGQVPAHWETPRLGSVALSIQTGPFGSQIHADDYVEDQVPLINPANIEGGKIVPNWSNTITPQLRDEFREYVLRDGDIILARRGEMGRCAVVDHTSEGWLCGTGSLVLRTPDRILSDFIVIYIRTPFVREWLSLQSNGATMENLNVGILSRMKIVVPTFEEQCSIFDFIRHEETAYSNLQNTAQNAIDLLKERRSALISAAVTGKIDVRGLVDTQALEPA